LGSLGVWLLNLRWSPWINGSSFTAFITDGNLWAFGPGTIRDRVCPLYASAGIARYVPLSWFSWPSIEGRVYLHDGQLLYAWMVSVPLWIPFLVGLFPITSWIVMSIRRKPGAGHCESCGYNLRSNVSGICPECGTVIENVELAPASSEQEDSLTPRGWPRSYSTWGHDFDRK
jgi:hypothetical protein